MTAETDAEWWEGALEEDTTWYLPLEGDGGLWAGGFPPPPPRPDFLDEGISPDGLTTCDLCTWARAAADPNSDSSSDLPGTLTWTVSLVIVSILSAILGAALMVSLMHCRRSQDEDSRWFSCFRRRRRVDPTSPQSPQLEDKEMVPLGGPGGRQGAWGWLTRRAPYTPPLHPPTVPAVNHYTLDEALYAELDRPAYQNTGYVSESSAPSSAYYSDLSNSDRTYEAVGSQTGHWDPRPPATLAAITESLPVPSDYV
ncbi:uncharacterized protein LOC128995043 [Macrosteles quadrilineatus]|uniref:uncharacterized protein LOC128995043 n=1 Tax=Macrosteles quadrilineatus TaxID=74068 RepID=UPI0023E12066|nr:uncharacterized protein LOC128995043 [Macrosteles quadrilineatus]